jgi:hypothetical protein
MDSHDFDVHVFNSNPGWGSCHGEMRNVTLHGCVTWPKPPAHSSVRCEGFWPWRRGVKIATFLNNRYCKWLGDSARKLAQLIDLLQPDIIHSHELSLAGNLVLEAKQRLKTQLPPWIVTNWGSDICHNAKLKAHQAKIREVLATCDYYTCETQRDVGIAREYGFKGTILRPVMPNPGGFRFDEIEYLRMPGPTSQRPVVMLKGYQHSVGRAIVGLRALEMCKDVLKDYKIRLHSCSDEVAIASEVLAHDTGLDIEIIPQCDYYELLRMRGQARVSIGLSMSDAASISFLEALVMGSFPIQSDRGATADWIEHGKTGLIVPPEDPDVVADALKRALTDDALVDAAARANEAMARERLDFYKLRGHVARWYEAIAAERGIAECRAA